MRTSFKFPMKSSPPRIRSYMAPNRVVVAFQYQVAKLTIYFSLGGWQHGTNHRPTLLHKVIYKMQSPCCKSTWKCPFHKLQASDLFPYIHVSHLHHKLKEKSSNSRERQQFVEGINSFVLFYLCRLCVIALQIVHVVDPHLCKS